MAGVTYDKVAGCLAGGAVADAIGYEVEFFSLDRILADRGPNGVRGPAKAGTLLEASDDTQMTLFTAEGMIRAAPLDADDLTTTVASINDAYLDWLGTQGRAARPAVGRLARRLEMCKTMAPGSTCLTALGRGGGGTPQVAINDSKGCGGVMRVAPAGLVPSLDMAASFDLGARAAALTHGHPEGWLSAGVMAAIVHLVAKGMPLAAASEAALEIALPGAAGERVAFLSRRAVHLAARGRLTPRSLTDAFGGGWTGEEALAIGLYAALAGRDFVDAIAIGATHSGDSDSTASVAGQLLGARDGLGCVPSAWWASLDLRDAVLATTAEFCAAFTIPGAPS